MSQSYSVPDILKGLDYIETRDLTLEQLDLLLEVTDELKKRFHRGEQTLLLPHQTAYLLFFDKSTRTRNAFEAGMTQLGGHAHFLDVAHSQISHGETAADTGRILAAMGHGICVRHDLIPGAGNRYMREMAEASNVPIINMQCDVDHPTQTLADLFTLRERFGTNLQGLKIAVSWAYAPSYAKPLSVPQGLITLMTRYGMNVTLAHPSGYDLMPDTLESAKQGAAASGGSFEMVHDMDAAFENADVVYPKSWGVYDLMVERLNLSSAEAQTENERQCLERNAQYRDWICDERRMSLAKPSAVYMHCLPADRGAEVTDAVIDGPQSIVFQEAENRLHTAKAIMACTMRERPF
ncbi:MAG: ornithine carbamoyltransferase [Planctomycetes bacterium]|nr:ornithine carbamoyltransferase [Planctomycetota bacterium]NOG52953.1 ornithine carbamoyltransferase [Planctomycetota bacterium]